MTLLSSTRKNLTLILAFFAVLLIAKTNDFPKLLQGIFQTEKNIEDSHLEVKKEIQIKDHAMNHDYEKSWKEIDSLANEGLPQSALKKTQELFSIAKGEENSSQIVKCLIYQGKFLTELEENGHNDAIHLFEKEIEVASFPANAILKSMLAQLYDNYLSDNLWMIEQRTEIRSAISDDIKTWTSGKFIETTAGLYLSSLMDARLKSLPIENFDAILTPGENEKGLRPTLFDFLAHRAIDYFMDEKSHLTQPVYMFQLEDEMIFAPTNEFIKWNPVSRDTSSRKLQTLKLFQYLLAFRLNAAETENPALVDSDLKRLRFGYDNAVMPDKANLYLQALENLRETNKGKDFESEIIYQLAKFYNSQGSDYVSTPFGVDLPESKNKWHLKKSVELCDEVIKDFPGSLAAKRCAILKNELTSKNLEIRSELVNLPEKPMLGRIDYKNITQAWLKIIRFEEKHEIELRKLQNDNQPQDALREYFNSLTPIESWSIKLPDDGDYRSHSAEFKINKQPLGKYLVIASGNKEFNSEGAITYLFTTVSNLGFWERRVANEGVQFVVFSRETGEPLKGVSASFYTRHYNPLARTYEWKAAGRQTSDKEGFVTPKLNVKDAGSYKVVFTKGKDKLDTENTYYDYQRLLDIKPFQQTTFFLDRAIYRPGQTVYFKGIALEFDRARMPSILKNESVTVTFRDANWQEIAILTLRTNDYGTFNGSFATPKTGLLGRMSLESSIGGQSKSLLVEEYKRPKFEVLFEPVKGAYRLNEEVNINGSAKAYAGNNIDGAQVLYRVVREVRYPWLPWWQRSWWPLNTEEMEITNGITRTDAGGKFLISFKAAPDPSISKEMKPEFIYKIHADVTDATGETRSNELYLNVGYISLLAEIDLGDNIPIDSFKHVEIKTTNLGGEFEPAKGSILFELLESPGHVFNERLWDKPDRVTMTESDFKRSFPHISWKMENLPENWKSKNTLYSGNFDTGQSATINISERLKGKIKTGWYVLRLKTMDKFGEKVEVNKFFRIYDPEGKSIPGEASGWYVLENDNREPGQYANFVFGTSEKKLHLFLELEKDGITVERRWLKMCGQQNFKQLIDESHRGNIHYTVSYAMYNRSTNASGSIQVPWSNKDLAIEFLTFRDRLLPGEKEEWTIKIKGPKSEKVAAEMVAAMYDASLDAFAVNNWRLNVFPFTWQKVSYSAGKYESVAGARLGNFSPTDALSYESREYRDLNWFNWYFGQRFYLRALSMSAYGAPEAEMMVSDARRDTKSMPTSPEQEESVDEPALSAVFEEPVKVRTNLNETVFFYPNLMTDAEGNILIKFTMNEALTRWKFLAFAHTSELETASVTKEIVTQKDLMIVPNPPRFFRENDEIEFTAKVVNLSDKTLNGNAQLQLINPLESMPVYKWEDNPQFNVNFSVLPGLSTGVSWRFNVPDAADVPLIEHTVVATAGDYSDAERAVVPVLTNRMLVTETMPMPVRANQTRDFVFNSLRVNNSSTLKHQRFTLEFTQNPAWYAVQALPYLMEYPYECSEQIFSRYYANALAANVANSHPTVKSVFDKWRNYEPDALLSNLNKNQELKSALLSETPWVLNAKNEEQQKQQIALLFDLNKMSYEQEASLAKLIERQLSNGGWSWFTGGSDSWYITQYIVEGLGHLQKLGVADIHQNPSSWNMVKHAVQYCDNRIADEYEQLQRLVAEGKAKWEDDHLSYLIAHYLYMRSFFLEDKSAQASTGNLNSAKGKEFINLQGKSADAHVYYTRQAEKYWLKKGIYTEGLLALSLNRTGKNSTAQAIVKSLKERSMRNEELGMYWKYPIGYWWYTAPLETQALMIEVFNDVANDKASVEEMKIWLLKNKQTNHWKTTKATSSAVYALLLTGNNWLLENSPLELTLGIGSDMASEWMQRIRKAQAGAEAGTGYFKTNFDGTEVDKAMGSIKVFNPNQVLSWGAAYWQYFENLDKITTFEETPLTLKKQVYKVQHTPTGEVLSALENGNLLKVGEKVIVRVELRVDRDMEYVHMKDMRASGLEPINVLSGYKWQGGLGYYESTKDASTDFFFSWLPKGTYVFEYPLRVTHRGNFSNGITSIQCMYAPEFSSHSEGIRLKVQ